MVVLFDLSFLFASVKVVLFFTKNFLLHVVPFVQKLTARCSENAFLMKTRCFHQPVAREQAVCFVFNFGHSTLDSVEIG